MNRCPATPLPRPRLLRHAAALCLAALAGAAVHAQVREFPATALRGVLQVTMPPVVVLDGKADRLSPGARIRGPANELVLSASIAGAPVAVNYVREPNGLLHEIWLLTPAEAALKRPGAIRERNFVFESELERKAQDGQPAKRPRIRE